MNSPDRRFEQGLEFFRQGNYQAAIRLWKALLDEGHPNPNLGLYLWAAQSNYGRMLQTVNDLAAGLGGADLRTGRDIVAEARHELSSRRPREALELLQEAIGLSPEAIVPRVLAARAALQCGLLADALGLALDAQRLKPTDTDVQTTLGQVLSEMGRTDDAEAAFRRALVVSDRLGVAWYGLAALRYRDRRLIDAERLLERALVCTPGLQTAREFLSEIQLEKHRFEEQLEDCRQMLAEHPGYADWQYRRAVLATSLGLDSEALEALDAAISLNPHMAKAWHQRALLHHAAGDDRTACGALRRVAELSGAASAEEAEAFFLAERYAEAFRAWFGTLRLTPDYASRHIELGKKLFREGLWEEAERALSRGVSMAPQYADGHHALGIIALGRGRAGEAIRYLRTALGYSPNFSEAAVKLVEAYLADGNITAARDTLEQWKNRLESDPRFGAAFQDLEKRSSDQPTQESSPPAKAGRPKRSKTAAEARTVQKPRSVGRQARKKG
ncbi:MAG: tetratricopeptide repeat protein [Candidatus Wallbacteria bacterium]|nr:tetratricopeptide repeat protein [Candidatus Wallbacteria bacterium]